MKYSYSEFLEIAKQFPRGIIVNEYQCRMPQSLDGQYNYLGMPAIFVNGGIVLLDRCIYCGSTDKMMYKNLLGQPCCSHCNAPILWDEYK